MSSGDKMEIYVDGDLPSERHGRILLFGPTGVGKSSFGGTMPGPRVVLAADANAGLPLQQTFDALPRAFVPEGETSRRPALFVRVSSWQQTVAAVDEVERRLNAGAGYASLVVDRLTDLCELCKFERLGGRPTATASSTLSMRDYGEIFLRIDGLRHRLHQLPLHVLWVCGAKMAGGRENEEARLPRRLVPDIVGQGAQRFPASCAASLYMERGPGPGGRSIVKVRTAPTEDYECKDNTGRLLPVEVPDAAVVLAKMGFLPPDLTAAVLAAVPGRSASPKGAPVTEKGSVPGVSFE